MHGHHQTFGASNAQVVRDVQTGRLPMLNAPSPLPPAAYYNMKPEGAVKYKGLVRNRSHVHIGDARQSHFETTMNSEFRDWGPKASPADHKPAPSRKEIELLYNNAQQRVPDWRIDEIENAMRLKIEQKTRGGAFVMRRAFKYFDRDGSGGVDLVELRDGLNLFGLQFDEHECAALMARYDTDYGGEIDYYEFIGNLLENDWFTKKNQKTKERIAGALSNSADPESDELVTRLASRSILTPRDITRMFAELDVDQSGHMDKNELLGFLYLLGIDGVCTSKEAVLREFNKMDKDKNGKVDKEEFTQWLRSIHL